jgi:hypothetical protein
VDKRITSLYLKALSCIIFVLALVFYTALAYSAEVTLQWNSAPEAEGYKIHYGSESMNYQTHKKVGDKLSYTFFPDPGTYYFAVTAYNNYGGSEYSREISATISEKISSTCLSIKLKAEANLCKALMKCYVNEIKKPGLDISASLTKAERKFESSWEKAETKATAKGEDCATAAETAIEDIIVLALEDIYNQIDDGMVNHDDKNTLNYVSALMKAIGEKCRGLLKAESANVKQNDPGKRDSALNKAEAKFDSSCDKAVIKADKKDVTHNVDIASVTLIIDDMVTDVLDGLGL